MCNFVLSFRFIGSKKFYSLLNLNLKEYKCSFIQVKCKFKICIYFMIKPAIKATALEQESILEYWRCGQDGIHLDH